MFRKVKGAPAKPEPIKAPAPVRQPQPQHSVPSPAQSRPQAAQAAPPATSTPPQQTQASTSPSGRNVLSSDVEIKGTIKFSNDLVVDGKIEGEIKSDGSLTVGENARIQAAIATHSVIIYGKVYGNIEVTHNVELKANAELVGDIKAAFLSIEPGAIFVGKSTVGKPSAEPKPIEKKQTTSSQPAKKEEITASKNAQQELSGFKKPTTQPSSENKPTSPQPIKKP